MLAVFQNFADKIEVLVFLMSLGGGGILLGRCLDRCASSVIR